MLKALSQPKNAARQPLIATSAVIRNVAPFLVIFVVSAWAGCRRSTSDSGAPIVASVGGERITKAEWTERLTASGATRADEARKRKLLDELVQEKLMIQEAKRQGIDKTPEIVRTAEQQMVSHLIRRQIDAKTTLDKVPKTLVDEYFENHQREFQQPEARRASQIVMATLKEAEAALNKAKQLAPTDEVGFRKLVDSFSVDADSKRRGGDIGFITRGAPNPNPATQAAIFALPTVGALSGPIQDGAVVRLFRLTAIRPGVSRSLAEVEPLIRSRLAQELRAQQLKDWMESLRSKAQVEVHEELL